MQAMYTHFILGKVRQKFGNQWKLVCVLYSISDGNWTFVRQKSKRKRGEGGGGTRTNLVGVRVHKNAQ